jgi:serine/threonine protein kinase
MITGHYPWQIATVQDKHFRDYLEDYSYLLYKLPISETANWIINRMLDPDPKSRITLPELRDEILNSDSFFASPYEPRKSPPEDIFTPVGNCDTFMPTQLSTIIRMIDDDDDTPSSSPNCNTFGSYHSEDHPITGRTLSSTSQPAWSTDLDSADSTSDESELPITPETIAVELDVEVSALSEGKILHEAVNINQVKLAKTLPLTTKVFAETNPPTPAIFTMDNRFVHSALDTYPTSFV